MKNKSFSKLNANVAVLVAATGIVISIAFIRSAPGESALTSKKRMERPLKNADVGYTSYKVDADKASVQTYYTGSEINIPAGAFVDDKGKPVTGKVDLKYREFHDAADFFVSGIPMTYDSAGTQYQFESAGMLEILAFQEGKPVFINPGKRIVVKMHSTQPDDKYNIYQYDSLAGNWKFVYKDRAGAKEMALAATASPTGISPKGLLVGALPATGKQPEPVKPVLLDKNNYQFNLDVKTEEFPEIAVYKDVQFEVKEGTNDFNKSYATEIWTDVQLDKAGSGAYLMTLTAGIESHTFEVNPVFDAHSFKSAYLKYLALLAGRRALEARQKKTTDSVHTEFVKERTFQSELMKSSRVNMAAQATTQGIIQRVFIVSGFGIWNSDCPAMLPKGEMFAAKYIDSTGKKIDFKIMYLVEKGRNAMFSLYDASTLRYDPTKKNTLWAVTADNKLAILEEKRFKNLRKVNDSCTITMTVIAKNITKAYEVRELLKLD